MWNPFVDSKISSQAREKANEPVTLLEIVALLETWLLAIIRGIAQAYNVLPDQVSEHTLGWGLAEFKRLQEERSHQVRRDIEIVQIGTLRALAALFGEKVPPLDEPVVKTQDRNDTPEWWKGYVASNPGVEL